ncbi:hypothetical protein ACDA63_07070 [Uliginosibacterium sp. sgz301328]|uniref:hypothetical protein n=1 Tax=Uliginosibacterium sp. sgz301328 TaxID=3243764 RepID=UPI00359CFFD9
MSLVNFTPPQFRAVVVAALVLALAALAFGAGWTAQGWRKDREIADIKEAIATDRAQAAERAASDMQSAALAMRTSADDVRRSSANLKASMAAITKELKNAPALPADCKPDAVRVRGLRDAYDAARRSAAGQ